MATRLPDARFEGSFLRPSNNSFLSGSKPFNVVSLYVDIQITTKVNDPARLVRCDRNHQFPSGRECAYWCTGMSFPSSGNWGARGISSLRVTKRCDVLDPLKNGILTDHLAGSGFPTQPCGSPTTFYNSWADDLTFDDVDFRPLPLEIAPFTGVILPSHGWVRCVRNIDPTSKGGEGSRVSDLLNFLGASLMLRTVRLLLRSRRMRNIPRDVSLSSPTSKGSHCSE